MRYVDRGECPPELDGANSPGGLETTAAIAFYADKKNHDKAFDDWRAYRLDSVRDLLVALFEGRCCYCESRFANTHSGDIEHYRPKGGYRDTSERLTKPGYYWLGAEWTNLLISCIDCNRARRHKDDEGIASVSGKASFFPLVDESKRATNPGSESAELPMLLDPCQDDVENLLDIDDHGLVKPVAGPHEPRAQKTIDIVGLQRRFLVQSRVSWITRVDGHIAMYQKACLAANAHPTDPNLQDMLREAILHLHQLWNGAPEFTVMVRKRIAQAVPEIFASAG